MPIFSLCLQNGNKNNKIYIKFILNISFVPIYTHSYSVKLNAIFVYSFKFNLNFFSNAFGTDWNSYTYTNHMNNLFNFKLVLIKEMFVFFFALNIFGVVLVKSTPVFRLFPHFLHVLSVVDCLDRIQVKREYCINKCKIDLFCC